MRTFDQRLKKLERKLVPEDPVILIMSDGSREELAVPRGGMLQLFLYLVENENSPEAMRLRKSVQVIETDGHMIELARALLLGPAVELDDPSPATCEAK